MELYQYVFMKRQEDPTYTQRKMAKLLGIHHQRLCAILHYKVTPSAQIAKDIEKLTGGLVNGWELLCKTLDAKKNKRKRK